MRDLTRREVENVLSKMPALLEQLRYTAHVGPAFALIDVMRLLPRVIEVLPATCAECQGRGWVGMGPPFPKIPCEACGGRDGDQ